MTAIEEINGYCTEMLSGRIKAARWEVAAVSRYRDDLARALQPNAPIYFDQSAAERAIAVIQQLQHTTGKFNGQRFVLEPWQKFLIWNIYGWYRSDGTRRFRHVYIEIARKNGKTALAAAIAHLEFSFMGEHRPEVYCVATKRAQSVLVWEEAKRMRSRSRFLQDRISVVESRYTMKEPGGGVFKALGGDGSGEDGTNPSCVLFDELHQFRNKGHMELWDKMRTGSDMRKQPIFIVITTAGDKNSLLWKSQRKYAEDVATGDVFDDSLFSFICAMEAADDEFDPDNWRKANPGLDSIKQRSGIAELADKARHDSLAHHQLLRYHCNRIVDSVNQFISLRIWDKGNKPLPALSGRICYGGLDLGWRDDLAAFALIFPPADRDDPKGLWYCKVWGFMPEESKQDLAKLPWCDWRKEDFLEITEGNTTDTTAIYERIDDCRTTYSLKGIGLDGNNARECGTQLTTKGYLVDEMAQQATAYHEAMQKFKELALGGRLIHGGCPLLRSAIENMVAKTVGGLQKPDKDASSDKIDPAVALLMALRRSMFNDDNAKVSRIRVVNVG